MKSDIYNREGKKAGSIELPAKVFDVKWNPDLVHQVVTGMQANARQPIAHTKDRSEQRGGGRKPWRQKGTGRARHGSRRSPIWRGGGVTHGPRNERSYTQKINKKMRIKALYSVLSKKYSDGEVLFIDNLEFTEPKTSEAKRTLAALSNVKGFESMKGKKKNNTLISVIEKDLNIKKSFSNFGNIRVDEVRNLNPVDVLTYKYLIVSTPSESFDVLLSRNQ